MKARVKATGEIISLDEKSTVLDTNPYNFNSYEISELEILYENTNFPKDYWQKLEHQYAGMAMQTMLATLYNPKYHKELMACYTEVDAEEVARLSKYYAHALVEKYKKEGK